MASGALFQAVTQSHVIHPNRAKCAIWPSCPSVSGQQIAKILCSEKQNSLASSMRFALPVPPAQRFLFTKNRNCAYSVPSCSDLRGVRVVTDVEAGCDGRGGHCGRAMSIRLRQNVGGTGTKPVERFLRKACRGLRRRVVLAPLGWCQVLRDDPQGDGD